MAATGSAQAPAAFTTVAAMIACSPATTSKPPSDGPAEVTGAPVSTTAPAATAWLR